MPRVQIPPPFNLSLDDRRSRGPWLFRIEGTPEVSWLNQEAFSVVLSNVGRKVGDFDEQRSWAGGSGGERFSDDPTKFKDSKEAFTMIDGHLFPSLQWNIATGYRDVEQSLPGSVSWRALYGSMQSISVSVTASATSNRDKAYAWIRRVGSPGTLTAEWRTNSGGSPSSTISKTVDVTTSDVTDVISVLKAFDWTGTTAVTSGTVYHLVLCGADADDEHSHWEVGVSAGTSGSKISASGAGDAGTWSTPSPDFKMYHRVVDADIDRRWWFFNYGAEFYKVSNESTAKLYKWNETDDDWDVVSGHGLGQVTGRPVEFNGFLYFPQGDAVAIRSYNGTNWDSQTIATGQGCATAFAVGYSAADNKAQLWRYNNTLVSGGTTTGLAVSVSRADPVAAYDTNLSFRASIRTGDASTTINRIQFHTNNVLWVFKSNSAGYVENDRYTETDYGLRKTPSADNGIASVGWQTFLFFNWLYSTERLYSGTLDDVGQGFKGPALPYGREGVDAAYTTYINWMFVAKDAGASGTSSVRLYDGLNWHEFARAWESGKRIRDVQIQTVSGARNRLWFDVGGDSVYIELPLNKANPLYDSGAIYMHECVVESSEIDMGTASKLPKFISEITMTSKNLNGAGIKVNLDYQVDDDIGETGYSGWTPTRSVFLKSPEDIIPLNISNIRKFAYRLRMHTDNQLTPPDVRGIVPSGFARAEARKVFNVQARVRVGQKGVPAEMVVQWLEEAAQGAFLVHVNSSFKPLDDYDCIVAPPSIFPIKATPETDVVSFSLLAVRR